MPRLTEFTAKIQFATCSRHPSLITKAAKVRGYPSNTAYLQRVVAEALSKDLDIPLQELIDELPPLTGAGRHFIEAKRRHPAGK